MDIQNIKDIFSIAIPAIVSFLGVVAGSNFAMRSAYKKHRAELLLEKYGKFVSAAVDVSTNIDSDNMRSLMLAISQLRLICCNETLSILTLFLEEALKEPQDTATLATLTEKIIKIGRKDVGYYNIKSAQKMPK